MNNLYNIETLFSQRLFCIPDYQRGYAWDHQQCQEFLEDLEFLEPGKDHFMGTLILHAQSNRSEYIIDLSGNSYTAYNIVDGQQRLTTIVILLHAITLFMGTDSRQTELAKGAKQKYIATQDSNYQPLAKLSLNEDSREFFQQEVLEQGTYIGGATMRSHQRLQQAKLFFREFLEQQQEERDGTEFREWLQSFFFKIIHRITLIVYTVDREADAGIIFETMNNRGKPITELEKVKNYLLYLAGKLHLSGEHQLVAGINQTWKHIFENLMSANLSGTFYEEQLLRSHWLMAYDPNPRNWEGSRSIKQQFNLHQYREQHKELLRDLRNYLNSLRHSVTAYCDILYPTRMGSFRDFIGHAAHDSIVAEAGRLARVGSLASFIPMLIAARLQRNYSGDHYLLLTEYCEKYAFRVYRWLQLRSNAGQTRLFRMGYQIYHGQMSIEQSTQRLQQLILSYASDTRFESAFENEAGNWYRWGGLKYFLYEYESHLAQLRGVPMKMPWEEFARKKDTIEHILPGTPDASGFWIERFPDELYDHWLHDIGNLVLTYDNSALSNRPFFTNSQTKDKKSFYTESVLLSEREISTYADWTEESIQDRRKKLKKWALQRWHVDPPVTMLVEQEVSENPTSDDFMHVLTRRPVPRGQKQLYKALYNAGDRGLTKGELVRVMGRRDWKDLTGVLGALGRRVNGTSGYGYAKKPGIDMLFIIKPVSKKYRYILRPEMKAALEQLNPPWLNEMVK